MLQRSTFLRILLLLAIAAVSLKTYRVWQEGPWDLPSPKKVKTAERTDKLQTLPKVQTPTNTDAIISRNLFDPERGASTTRQVEANTRTFQRIRGMVLVGTAVIGNERVAIIQDGNLGNTPGAAQPIAPMRLKLGETVEGFRVSEITDTKVTFTKGPARVEVTLDYFRPPDLRQPGMAAPKQQQPAAPPVAPARDLPNPARNQKRPAVTPDEAPEAPNE